MPTFCLAADVLGACDLRFDVPIVGLTRIPRFKNSSSSAASLRQHAAVINIAAHMDAHAADQRWLLGELNSESRSIKARETASMLSAASRRTAATALSIVAVCWATSSLTRRRKCARMAGDSR